MKEKDMLIAFASESQGEKVEKREEEREKVEAKKDE